MLSRLILTDFRNHAEAVLHPGRGFVVLTGENGAGKTNVLEALSLFAPGRGLRRAQLAEMAMSGGGGGFAVSAELSTGGDAEPVLLGTGTDPAPYFRIFNPITQGRKFDPNGDYVRRWVPELRGVEGGAVHEPWKLRGGLPEGYPERIVEHDVERAESLARYRATTGRGGSP